LNKPVPVLVAHRGFPARYPENTLEGLAAALGAGACYIEFDIQLSKDAIPVLLHDESLARTTGVDISVFDCTAIELQQYSAGEPSRLGENFKDVRIPTLAEVVTMLEQRPDVSAFVEIKRSSLRHFGHEAVIAAVTEAIMPAREQCILISFDYTLVEEVKSRHIFRTGWVIKAMDAHTRDLALQLAPDFLFFGNSLLQPSDQALWSGTWQWVIYTIDDPEQALQLVRQGIAFVETDAIGDMLVHPILRQKICGNGQGI